MNQLRRLRVTLRFGMYQQLERDFALEMGVPRGHLYEGAFAEPLRSAQESPRYPDSQLEWGGRSRHWWRPRRPRSLERCTRAISDTTFSACRKSRMPGSFSRSTPSPVDRGTVNHGLDQRAY